MVAVAGGHCECLCSFFDLVKRELTCYLSPESIWFVSTCEATASRPNPWNDHVMWTALDSTREGLEPLKRHLKRQLGLPRTKINRLVLVEPSLGVAPKMV